MHAIFTEVNLLPKFEYPVACTDIKVVHGSEHLISCGVYRPSVRVYNLSDRSVVSDRNIQNEPIEIVLVDGIYKYGILTDRNKIEIHDRAGLRALVKVPASSRSVTHVPGELLVGGSKGTLARYSLAKQALEGSVGTGLDETVKVKAMGPSLIGVCSTDGFSVVDLRSCTVACTFLLREELMSFDFSERVCFVGDKDGCVHVIDLGLQKEVDQLRCDVPVRAIKSCGDFLMASSKVGLKMWRDMTPTAEISLESNVNVVDSFGPLVFLGLEASKARTFYVPDMGCLPSWCCSVESLVVTQTTRGSY